MTEQDLQRLVIDAARVGGWRWYHTHDSRRSAPGFPDVVLVRAPELLFVELKSERGRIRPEQSDWLDALAACGAEAAIVRPADADDLVARLLAPRSTP